ncbi:hypothetical protein GCM10020254_10060 [Streptomyces goshikiensis]
MARPRRGPGAALGGSPGAGAGAGLGRTGDDPAGRGRGPPPALSVFLPSPTRPGLAEIATFYGHPDGWGTGVAAALMTETLRRLGDEGCAGAHLWTLRDTPRSRRFYAKCGFTETGATRTFDFGEGNLLAQVEYERTG